MPLYIGRVEADVDMTADSGKGAPFEGGSPAQAMTVDAERLRPIVLQILQEEMAAFRRQQG